MVTGAIAYDLLLQDSPKALTKALALLRAHPQYTELIAKRVATVAPEDRDRYLFMVAARWPDDIRDDEKYHHSAWHYIDFPFVPPGQPDTVKPQDPGPQNVVVAIKTNIELLTGSAPASEKAVALCWVMHAIGDVHQPLHAVSLYSTVYPQGDRGGNLFFVRAENGSEVLNLHMLWDGLLLRSEKYRDAVNVATELRNRPELAKKKLTELSEMDVEKWASGESFEAAKASAYLNGKLAGSAARGTAPVLPAGYLTAAKAVAERRVILAGHRLAQAIKISLSK